MRKPLASAVVGRLAIAAAAVVTIAAVERLVEPSWWTTVAVDFVVIAGALILVALPFDRSGL